MVAYSKDGGRTWRGHRSISHKNVWEHHRVWVAPQLSRLSDGRLAIICDLAHRTSHEDWPTPHEDGRSGLPGDVELPLLERRQRENMERTGRMR